jgi:hypothetical protein
VAGDGRQPVPEAARRFVGEALDIAEGAEKCFLQQIVDFDPG